jgi:hypothetical protein
LTPAQVIDQGKQCRRAGLTLQRMLDYYAHDIDRYPPQLLEEGWRWQDGVYQRVRAAMEWR